MKTTLATALAVFLVAGLLQSLVIAEAPELDETPQVLPSSPDAWEVWGEAEFDGVKLQAKPVDCVTKKADVAALCVELYASNTNDDVRRFALDVELIGRGGEPMGRMMPPPIEVATVEVEFDLAADTSTVRRVKIVLPKDQLPGQLSLALRSNATDDYQEVAAWNDPSMLALVY